MILNFEDTTRELTDAEMEALPYVREALKTYLHRHRELAITSPNVCRMVNEFLQDSGISFSFSERKNDPRIRKFVSYLRCNEGLPIIGTSKGYFITDDADEIHKQILSLTQRARQDLRAAEGLGKFLTSRDQHSRAVGSDCVYLQPELL